MNFSAGIHVLINREDKYLVVKRSPNDDDEPNKWDLPGGGIDYGEQPGEAAKREVKEEVDLDIKVGKVLDVNAIEYENTWSIEINVEAQYVSGEVKISPEHTEYLWVSMQELIDLEPKNYHLQMLLKHLQTNI